jgi:hypothetical protein
MLPQFREKIGQAPVARLARLPPFRVFSLLQVDKRLIHLLETTSLLYHIIALYISQNS